MRNLVNTADFKLSSQSNAEMSKMACCSSKAPAIFFAPPCLFCLNAMIINMLSVRLQWTPKWSQLKCYTRQSKYSVMCDGYAG